MIHSDDHEDVLRDSRFWTVSACLAFLDSWDDLAFEKPQTGHRLAAIGIELVARVEQQTGGEHCALRARALAIRGSASRITGNLEEAQQHFEEAHRLYRELEEPLAEADLYRRLVFLHRDLQQWEEALECANRSAKIFLAAGDQHNYGLVLMVEATVFGSLGDFARAITVHSKSLAKLDYNRAPRAFYAAVHNLAGTLAVAPEPDRELLDTALYWLREARRVGPQRGLGTKHYGYRKRTVPDAKLRYLLALLLRRKGRHRTALRFLEQAREDLVDLGMPIDVVDVSLDLGELYAREGRWAELRRIASEALELVAPFPHLIQLSETLCQWQTAIVAGAQVAEIAARCRALMAHNPSFEPVDERAVRRQLREALEAALCGCRNLEILKERLRSEGITVHHRPAKGGRPAGIAFELRGRRFTGHQLGRGFRLSNIRNRLELDQASESGN